MVKECARKKKKKKYRDKRKGIHSNFPQIIWNNKLASSVTFVFPVHLSVLFVESTAAFL